MSIAVVTGAGGLIGSEAVTFLVSQGLDVVGVDNDMRSYFFGPEASTSWRVDELRRQHSRYQHRSVDVRDKDGLNALFADLGSDVMMVLHAAAQPSHDWAAREPFTDFGVNALGTLNMLEATRHYAPEAAFLYMSTNKVYGDTPNRLPLVEHETRLEVAAEHPYFAHGIDESMSIDQSTHSLFGVSKLSADALVQEYGRYFDMKTGCFRGGCLTGGGHSSTELHGFLAYLMKCTVTGRPYTIYGYGGKQVRDNIHSHDLVQALWRFAQAPGSGKVYNVGGGRTANCSMLEAIELCQAIAGRKLNVTYSDQNRIGDHMWWISDMSRFEEDYPGYRLSYDLHATLEDIHEMGRGRWLMDA